MKKEEVKKILNSRYYGKIMSAGSIVDIVADAIELSSKNVTLTITETPKIGQSVCGECKQPRAYNTKQGFESPCPHCGDETPF